MFRKLMAGFIALLWSVMALAAVEANKANEAELTSIKGIGPAMSARILEERKSAPFKDWPDFIARVKGVAEPTATKFSGEGLTVNGSSYKGHSAKPDAKDTAAKGQGHGGPGRQADQGAGGKAGHSSQGRLGLLKTRTVPIQPASAGFSCVRPSGYARP